MKTNRTKSTTSSNKQGTGHSPATRSAQRNARIEAKRKLNPGGTGRAVALPVPLSFEERQRTHYDSIYNSYAYSAWCSR